MTFTVHELEDGARVATGLDDFGSPYYREGLERTVDALNNEADLNELGGVIQHATISNALIQRLRIVDTYKQHPEIADEVIEGPVFVIGLPRTGTTALSQLVANDPQFRSLRMWESQACTPPPEAETQHDDPRIAAAAEGLAMMDNMFPRMRTMMNSEPQAATECQDLMGMSFRTFHFDGVVRVPGYLAWLMQCDMPRRTHFTGRCSNCFSGTARRTCGTSRLRFTCSASMRSWRPIRMPSSCGVIAIRRRCWRRSAA